MEKSGVIERFDGANFSLWKLRMSLLLKKKGLWNMAANPPVRPAQGEDAQKTWDLANNKALALICLALNNDMLGYVSEKTTAKDAWDTLLANFEQKGMVNEIILRRQITSCKLEEGEDVGAFVNRVRAIARELKAIGVELEDKEIITYILNGLPEQYDLASLKIEETEEGQLSVDGVVKTLNTYEKRIKNRKDEAESSKSEEALYVRNQSWRSANRNGRYQGNGNQGQYRRKRRPLKCFNCGELGHKRDACPKPKNESTTNSRGFKAVQKPFPAAKNPAVPGMWYIDTGASSHMTGDRSTFVKYMELTTPTMVNVANGQAEQVRGMGSVILRTWTPKGTVVIELKNVLYVPTFTTNLMSVACMRHGCRVEFKEFECDVVDVKTGKMLVRGCINKGTWIARLADQKALAMQTDEASVDESNYRAY